MDRDYKVKLEVFEGPLDLLLYLIKKDEVDIYDVSIERITKQYLAYLETFEMLNIELAGEFIVMAANLLYIKSRMLLPVDQQMAEEDAEEDDPRWELIRQLIEYKKFKEAATRLREREAMQEALFPRMPAVPELEPEGKLFAEEVGIFDLINAFQKILKRHEEKPEDLKQIFEENFTVGDKIEHLLKLTSAGVPMKFEELFTDAATRGEIVVTFLAMLELIRMKHLRVRQADQFGEIWIEPLGADAKPYFSKAVDQTDEANEPAALAEESAPLTETAGEAEVEPAVVGSEDLSRDIPADDWESNEAELPEIEVSGTGESVILNESAGLAVEAVEIEETPETESVVPVVEVGESPAPSNDWVETEIVPSADQLEPAAVGELAPISSEEIAEANESLGFGEIGEPVLNETELTSAGVTEADVLEIAEATPVEEFPSPVNPDPKTPAEEEPDSRPLGA